MFERFTDRARRVMVLAQDAARELGEPLIRPEHLGLGLLQSDGVSGQVLREFGVTYPETLARVVAVTPEDEAPSRASGRLPFNFEAKKVLERSVREALGLRHKYIGTEHLLLALLNLDEQLGADLFRVDLELVRTRIVQYVTGSQGERAPRSPALNAVLGRAQGAAGDGPMTTGHLLLALAGDRDSQAGKALARLHVSEGALVDALRDIPVDDTSDAPGPPRWFEIRLGGRTEVFRDPELAKVLADVTPEQIRAWLRKGVESKDSD